MPEKQKTGDPPLPLVPGFRWVLACLFCLLCGAARSQQNSLLTKATEVADVSLWKGRSHTFYRWLSNDHVLYVLDGRSIPLAFFSHDLASGKDTYLKGWDKTYHQTDLQAGVILDLLGIADTLEISPDGNWFLWRDNDVFVSRKDGSQLKVRQEVKRGSVHWMEDNRHWLELVHHRAAQITAVRFYALGERRRPREVPIVPIQPKSNYLYGTAVTVSDKKLTAWICCMGSGANTIVIYELNLKAKPITWQKHDVIFPVGYSLYRVIKMAFSPDGKQAAWLLEAREKDGSPTIGLWISRMDGSQMHEIGSVADTRRWYAPRDLQWLPDGKRLSFIYDGALWTLPAE